MINASKFFIFIFFFFFVAVFFLNYLTTKPSMQLPLIDRFLCHAIKKIKNIQWIKSRNRDVIENKKKEDISPSFKSVRFPKLWIFAEMFRRNLQSPV